MSREMDVEHVVASRSILGEGPLWDEQSGRLFWVDAFGEKYQTYEPGAGTVTQYPMGFYTITLGFRASGGMIVCSDTQIGLAGAIGDGPEWIATANFDHVAVRFNDGRVAPDGSLFLGSMHRTEKVPDGCLYRITPNGAIETVQDDVIISNGLGWSPDRQTFYHTDSVRKAIYAYDYDELGGGIANRRVLVDSQDEEGVPDGLCVDTDGCIWSARWNGWRVTRYDPEGGRMLDIPMPVAQPTSCAFGGPNLSDLYVTSGRVDLSEQHLRDNPTSGDLFVIPTDVTGQTEYLFAG